MYKLFMALRYLRSHRIIYFSIAGVAIGIMVMIVVTSVMGGFSRDLRRRIRGMQSDLVVVQATPNVYIADYRELCDRIRKIPGVSGCAPRIEWKGWLRYRTTFKEVTFLGIVPEEERKVSDLERFFREGGKRAFDFSFEADRIILDPETPPVVIGKEFPFRGMSEFRLMTLRYDNQNMAVFCHRDFAVAGSFKSGMAEYDHNYLIMPLKQAQDFMKFGSADVVTTVAVELVDYERDKNRVRKEILALLHRFGEERHHKGCQGEIDHAVGLCGRYQVRTWEEVKRILLQAVAIEKGIQIIVLFFIIIVAGFNIMAIYTLVVKAKDRDIGVMRALGATPGGVITVFILSGMFCGLVGSLIGIGAGLAFSFHVNEIADFVEVGSREFNQLALWQRILTVTLAAPLPIGLVLTWISFYYWRNRGQRFLFALILGGVLAGATWFFLGWLSPHAGCVFDVSRDHPHNPALRAWTTLIVGVIPVVLVGVREILRRGTRDRLWGLTKLLTNIIYSGLLWWGIQLASISVSVVTSSPSPNFTGLNLFDKNVYYLDRIPVFVDYFSIALIVIMTLAVSFVFSIYPAFRAAKSDPIEAIRE